MIFIVIIFIFNFHKEFKTKHAVYDLLILLGLTITFKSININSTSPPNINFILIPFIAFMIVYFLWDNAEISISKKIIDTKDEENQFYKSMVKWEILSFSAFSILLGFSFFDLHL